jgi:hypothetical protein
MTVEEESVTKDNSSCNFCDKGELSKYHTSLKYPYDIVFTFKRDNGNGLMATICQECLEELYIKSKSLQNSNERKSL